MHLRSKGKSGDKLRLKGLCPQTCFGHNASSQPRKGGAGTELLIPIATVSATSSASGFLPRTGWKQQFFLGVHLPVWNSKPKTKAGMCRHFYCTHKRSRSAQAGRSAALRILPLLSLLLSSCLNTLALCTDEQGTGFFLLRIQKRLHFIYGQSQKHCKVMQL